VHDLLKPVLGHLIETADRCILPRFRALKRADIQTKSGPHDLVTITDRESEAALSVALTALLPGSVAVGEEAVAQDAALLSHLSGPHPCWIIDPVDGTWNFAHGDDRFCVMVALSIGDQVEAAWILEPLRQRGFVAARTMGTWRYDLSVSNGEPVQIRIPSPSQPLTAWRGSAYHSGVDNENARPRPERQGSAAIEYVRILCGEAEFALYDRVMPWDHAPGSLLLREADGAHAFVDGGAYCPSAGPKRALLGAASPAGWRAVRGALLPGLEHADTKNAPLMGWPAPSPKKG